MLRPIVRRLFVMSRRVYYAVGGALRSVHPRPVFVLGNQKSGTTAIAALLGQMTGLPATLDLRREIDDPCYELLRNGTTSFEDFVRRNRLDFSRLLLKEPSLTVFYDELMGRFPESRVVFVMRDPRDNIRSILNRLNLPGDLRELDAERLRRVPRAWQHVIDGRWLGLKGNHYVDMLAERWNLISGIHLTHCKSVVSIRYEDFVADKVGEIGRLADALGLARERDISDHVDVAFQPRGDRGVRWETFFGLDNLSRIERVCGERMPAEGYRPTGSSALRTATRSTLDGNKSDG